MLFAEISQQLLAAALFSVEISKHGIETLTSSIHHKMIIRIDKIERASIDTVGRKDYLWFIGMLAIGDDFKGIELKERLFDPVYIPIALTSNMFLVNDHIVGEEATIEAKKLLKEDIVALVSHLETIKLLTADRDEETGSSIFLRRESD